MIHFPDKFKIWEIIVVADFSMVMLAENLEEVCRNVKIYHKTRNFKNFDDVILLHLIDS